MIVRQRIPVPKRGVIIPHPGNVKIICVHPGHGDDRFLTATGQNAGGQTAKHDQTDLFTPFHRAAFLRRADSGCSCLSSQSISLKALAVNYKNRPVLELMPLQFEMELMTACPSSGGAPYL